MKNTVREKIENFVFPHLEYFTGMVYEGGEDTVFRGVRLLDDKERFTHGALVNAACHLYAHYVRTGDVRRSAAFERLLYFINLVAAHPSKTWGKLAVLRGFNVLYENSLVGSIPPELVELVKQNTDYEDFFDKKALEAPGMAMNYMHVAMACAGYREKLGWENGGYADMIKEKICRVISEKCENGWLDDEIPYGRFDRYSLVFSSELYDTSVDVGIELPESILANLMESAEVASFMANARGDGVLFGRSVPCHGDLTPAECIASALSAGLVEKREIPRALAYVAQVLDKVITKWYDPDEKSFNIWWGGRTTNRYRGVGRILEVNLDVANHLLTTLKNLERAGLADSVVDESCISSPCEWKAKLVAFSEKPGASRKVLFARLGDLLVSLPFIGHGREWGKRSAYYAFPVISEAIEASPIAEYPFFIPEYVAADGKAYRPGQYFDTVDLETGGGQICIRARGWLSGADTNLPQRSDHRFEMVFTLEGAHIRAEFTTGAPYSCATMITGRSSGDVQISVCGFDESAPVSTECREDFDGVHARIFDAVAHKAYRGGALGYCINIENLI